MNIKKFIASVTTLAMVGSAMAVSTMTTASADSYGQAWIMMQQGNPPAAGVSIWSATDSTAVDITGNGTYTLSYDIPEGCAAEQIDFLGISTDINVYQQNADEEEMFKNMTFDITSITVDGVEIEYNGSANANGTNDDGATYRLSIYDEWSNRGIKDIDNGVACTSNITITFDVNGIIESEVAEPVEGDITAAETSFNIVTDDLAIGASNDKENGKDSDKDNDKSKDKDKASEETTVTTANTTANTTVTTTNSTTTNPSTGDAGLGAVVVALAVAGLSAVTLKKKN